MTPADPPQESIDPEVDVDFDVAVKVTSQEGAAPNAPASYLIRFSESATADEVERVLGRLQPEQEGIICAASRGVIVSAGEAFVEYAASQSTVDLVHAVYLPGNPPGTDSPVPSFRP